MKNIVILGGSFAGVSTAHRILKQVINSIPFRVTLVSPNTDFYWNIASPRGIIPGQIEDEKLFQPISAGFDQYPAGQFEFVLGYAESLDVDAKKVRVSNNITLDYDFLILGTGTNAKEGMPFKGVGSTQATKDALHTFQAKVAKAKTIVICGAGVTGVEVAGELGFEYRQTKKIILLGSGSTVLENSPASVSKLSANTLQKLNVDIKLQTKMMSSIQKPDGRQELVLSSGEKLAADLTIPTFGLVPNSSYVPERFLNAQGYVVVDEYLKVKNARSVWAIGDVCDTEYSQFLSCDRQSVHVAKAISFTLRGDKIPPPYQPFTSPLAQGGKYDIRAITRSIQSTEAKILAKVPNVTLFHGNPYDEADLQKAYKGVQLAFANTNGFAIGEKAEIYWGIHMYELAVQNRLEHFVWAVVDHGSKLGGFAAKYRCGHLDGKNKVTEYLKSQPKSPVAWSVLSSCPYLEMLSENWRPKKDEGGTYVFAVPLGDGSVPMIHLEDLGLYCRWIFDNPVESEGINLEVATTHIGLDDLVQKFQEVTGKPTTAVFLTTEEYFADGYEPLDIDKKLGYGTDGSDKTLQTAGQNFIGFFNVWRDNLAKRDYPLLNKILPTRVKSLEEWMRKTNYTGDYKPVLIDVSRGNFPIKGE